MSYNLSRRACHAEFGVSHPTWKRTCQLAATFEVHGERSLPVASHILPFAFRSPPCSYSNSTPLLSHLETGNDSGYT